MYSTHQDQDKLACYTFCIRMVVLYMVAWYKFGTAIVFLHHKLQSKKSNDSTRSNREPGRHLGFRIR